MMKPNHLMISTKLLLNIEITGLSHVQPIS